MRKPAELIEPTILVASDELTTLKEFLEYQRWQVLSVIENLDQAQMSARMVPSLSTLGGIVKHLAFVEDIWFQARFLGKDMPEPWTSAPFKENPDWEFESALTDSPESIWDLYLEACARSRNAIDGVTDLDSLTVAVNKSGQKWNLRWILVHMIEETAQHVGHLEILKESLEP
ncbi:DinB superfamily protein [mine drainage metagenome]|uniref:DinB superfamily protein n=1 Tax=mine drainage metagenome TaxID=410659 RepID=A0A1J5PEB7_9ZZZZ